MEWIALDVAHAFGGLAFPYGIWQRFKLNWYVLPALSRVFMVFCTIPQAGL
jgi:hypothetical protein